MLKFRRIKKLALFVQVNKYKGIGFLYKYSCVWSFFCHISLSVYKLYKRKVVIAANTVIILTKCRSDMNDTGTVAHSNIAVTYYKMRFFLLFCSCLFCAFPERFILFIFQIFTLVSFQNLVCFFIIFCQLAENLVHKSLSQIIGITVCCFYLTVGFIRVYAKRQVGRQCPRCCCPCKEIGILAYHLKAYDSGTLFYSFVALGNLLCRKRSSTARAVRNNLKSFIKKIFIPDFFQRPPLRLNVIIIISYIWMLHVSPETNG